MANSQLTKTNPTANTDSRKKGTISFWVKRGARLSSTNWLYTEYSDSNNAGTIYFSSAGNLHVISYDSGTTKQRVSTAAKHFDPHGWMHVCFAYDTTLATADDRQKLWVNGVAVEVTDRTNPAQNANVWFGVGGSNYPIRIGGNGSSDYFDGYFAHFHRVDSQALDVSVFGEYDSTTGIWKPKTSPSITYTGTSDFNFFLDFADSSNLGNDVSGENNDLSASGNMKQTITTPSNIFAVMNPLDSNFQGSSFSNGNTTVQTVNSVYTWNVATLGVSKGKYYWEVKYDATSGSNYNLIGIAERPTISATDYLGSVTSIANYGYYSDNGKVYAKSGTATSYGNSYSAGDIIGVALDLDNNKLYFSKNGTWQNSGDPTSGSTGTGAISIDAASSTTSGFYFPAFGDYGSTINITNSINFGTGYFGQTAVSSAGTNSGIGTFEYNVPSGYKALCTKNINEQEYS